MFDRRSVIVIIAALVGLTTMKSNSTARTQPTHVSKEQKNNATILQIFRAIEERDEVQFRKLVQPDFEIHWPPSLPYGGTFRGLNPRPHDWNATWDLLQPTNAEKRMDAKVIAAKHDNVVVLWHPHGLSSTGARFDGEVLGFYTFRQGKLARAQMFYFDTAAVARFLAEAKH
jgi:ketosteroid isomerase-like protein